MYIKQEDQKREGTNKETGGFRKKRNKREKQRVSLKGTKNQSKGFPYSDPKWAHSL